MSEAEAKLRVALRNGRAAWREAVTANWCYDVAVARLHAAEDSLRQAVPHRPKCTDGCYQCQVQPFGGEGDE